MNGSPHWISDSDQVCNRGKGVNESKAGEDEDRETRKKCPVLDALIQRHARNRGVLKFTPRDCLAPPHHDVVHYHCADDEQNDAKVEPPDPVNDGGANASRGRGFGMNGESCELGCGSRMTLAAGCRQIRFVDGGARIGGRQDQVRTVAACAIGHDCGAQSGSQAVIACLVAGNPGAGNPKFSGQSHTLVTACTGDFGQRLRGNGRGRIVGRLNCVDSVTIGTNWRKPIAASDRLAMDTLNVFSVLACMALAACAGHIELEGG